MPKLEDYVGGIALKTWFFIIGIGILLFYLFRISEEVTKTHFFLGIGLLIGLIATILTSETKKLDFIDIIQARKFMDDYIKTRKNIKLESGEIIDIGKYDIDDNFILREERVGKDRIPYKYVLQIKIIDTEGMEHYVKGYINPFRGNVMGFMNLERPLEEKDQCPNCGNEFDIEFVDTEDYRKLKRIKEETKD